MQSIDDSRKNFENLINSFESFLQTDLTESDTRSKILDTLLINALGWSENEVKREGYTIEGYYDYLVTTADFKFVIEAKRNMLEFVLPKSSRKIVSINTIYSQNSDVIKQIRKYLFEESLQYGIITNGRQFIIGKFINDDGIDWKKNKVTIFDGFEDILNRYVDFFNTLSHCVVIENSGFSLIEDEVGFAKTIHSIIPKKDSEIVM